MNAIFKVVLPVLGSFMIYSATNAQVRGGRGPVTPVVVRPQPLAHAPIPKTPPNKPGTQIRGGAQSCCQAPVVPTLPVGQEISRIRAHASAVSPGCRNGAPGLGFDVPHLAAICGNSILRPPIGNFGYGAPYYSSYAPIDYGGDSNTPDSDPYANQRVQQQPQGIYNQAPAPSEAGQQGAPAPNTSMNANGPSNTSSPNSPLEDSSVRDVSPFVFLRRDGKVLFASAFLIREGQVLYVTPEGIRHTISVAQLDADATRQMNDELGSEVDIRK
jgi:hypothetical protein